MNGNQYSDQQCPPNLVDKATKVASIFFHCHLYKL